MVELLTEAGFESFKYQRLVMHYDQTDPAKLDAYAHYLVALWQSVLPDLIKSGKFTEDEFAKVKEELFQASTLRQEAGQVIVNVF